MIRGELCVSCHNRQRELLGGKNTKGTAPVKAQHLQPDGIRFAIEGAGVSDYLKPVCSPPFADLHARGPVCLNDKFWIGAPPFPGKVLLLQGFIQIFMQNQPPCSQPRQATRVSE